MNCCRTAPEGPSPDPSCQSWTAFRGRPAQWPILQLERRRPREGTGLPGLHSEAVPEAAGSKPLLCPWSRPPPLGWPDSPLAAGLSPPSLRTPPPLSASGPHCHDPLHGSRRSLSLLPQPPCSPLCREPGSSDSLTCPVPARCTSCGCLAVPPSMNIRCHSLCARCAGPWTYRDKLQSLSMQTNPDTSG